MLETSSIIEIKALILDMDGVLWRGEEPIVDLTAVFASITERGWQLTLATNNATLSIDQYLAKLQRFGVALHPEQIVNSSIAVAHYLRDQHPHGGMVYIVGEAGLEETLTEYGFQAAPLTPQTMDSNTANDVIAVVAAMDRNVTYEKLTVATKLIRSGVQFIGTNPDPTFPTPQGLIPGAGAVLAAIETASDVAPLVIGKPSPEMYKIALDRMNVNPENSLVVGDRLETDISGGQQIGCRTALVLSGVTTADMGREWRPRPDWVSPDLASLIKVIDRRK